jgi:hypothetical protein
MKNGSLIQGKINLFNDADVVQRVSYIFCKGIDPFIVLFDATAEDKNGQVLILNKRNIVWVSPEEDRVGQDHLEDEKPEESRGSWMEGMRKS